MKNILYKFKDHKLIFSWVILVNILTLLALILLTLNIDILVPQSLVFIFNFFTNLKAYIFINKESENEL